MMQAQLGMVPSWQYSLDPGVNIKLNDHVAFPPGWSQGTVQPQGAYYTTARIAQPDLGRPSFFRRFSSDPGCCNDCRCGGANPCCDARTLRGFDSWAFEHRKGLVLGGLGLIVAAGLGVAAAFLK